jgi:zinc/manganese transport system substrate-binding protein
MAVAILALVAVGGALVATNLTSPPAVSCQNAGKVQVVAGENFWGSLITQVGGTHVSVTSIVTDPNADPHEYESNAANAQAVADACFVIANGAGYDSWLLSLIAASNSQHQTILNVQQFLGQPATANPHFWYSPYYVNATVKEMYRDLVKIDPADATYYRQQYVTLNASLGVYNARILEIASKFAGTKVAATEDIFVYLANATKLDLVSPPGFMQAVAEGNDPAASDVAAFQQLLQNKSVSLLVYNQQTVTPLTENMKSLAAQNSIPTVGVTETIQPPDVQFQVWMNAQLIAIQNGLNAKALGQ